MNIFKKIFGFIRTLNSDLSPLKISLATAVGVFWGMSPFFSPHNLFLLLLVIILKIPINFALLGMTFFLPYSFIFADSINVLGRWILKGEMLSDFFESLYNSFWILSKFNNTFIMGSFFISLLLFFPVFFILKFVVENYRYSIKHYLINTSVYQKFLKKTKIFNFILNIQNELQKEKVQKKENLIKKGSKILGWIDLKFSLPLFVMVVLVVIGVKYFLDDTIKTMITKQATEFNQAIVELRHFSSSFIQNRASLYDLQWTDRKNPTHNLFQFQSFTADAQVLPLLRSRFVFDELSLINFRLNTPRKKSGYLQKEISPQPTTSISTPLPGEELQSENEDTDKKEDFGQLAKVQNDVRKQLDRMAEDAKTEINHQKELALKQSQDILSNYEKQVKDLEKKFNFQKEISQFESIQLDEIKDIPTAMSVAENIGGIDSTIDKVNQASQEVKSLRKNLENDLNKVMSSVNPDRIRKNLEGRILSILGLDTLSLDNFSRKVLGPSIFSQVNTFIDYYQRYKDLLLRKRKDMNVEPETSYDPSIRAGSDVLYPVDNPFPRFYVKKILGTGDPEVNGIYKIDIENLSSDIDYAPIRNALSFKYDIFNIDLNGEISTTEDMVNLSQEIKSHSFPLTAVVNLSPNILIESLQGGVATVAGKIEDRNQKIKLTLVIEVEEVVFSINPSLNLEIKKILQATLNSINILTLRIVFEKAEDSNPKVKIISNLDRLLINNLSKFFKDYAAEKQREALGELKKSIEPALDEMKQELTKNTDVDLFKGIDSDIYSVSQNIQFLKRKINSLQKEQKDKVSDEVKKKIKLPF